MYKRLHLDKIIDTISRLESRIHERFPDSGLRHVCSELGLLASSNKARIAWIRKPNLPIRAGVGLLLAAAVVATGYSIGALHLKWKVPGSNEILQLADATLNTFFLVGASIFFMATLETRIKRARALAALHELRAIAHVVDMHQLTKDPNLIGSSEGATASSPKRDLNPFQLRRYLDYCAEMLALIGKLAALYSQNMPDTEIVKAANEIESLCSSLSHKVWQKIQLIEH